MRVMEMKELPKKAGQAKLHFLPLEELTDRTMAQRKGKELFFLRDEGARFYPLKKGEQFLYTNSDSNGGRHLVFGGMDESPFLVQLDITALENLFEGEESFFEGLKPAWIRNAEKETKRKAKRQGDFFAFPSTKDLSTFVRTYMQRGNKAEIQIVDKTSLRGTRHLFTGVHFSVQNHENRFLISGGEGTIEAPDHTPLQLEGPHIIMQALHLVRPKEAD